LCCYRYGEIKMNIFTKFSMVLRRYVCIDEASFTKIHSNYVVRLIMGKMYYCHPFKCGI